MHPTWYRARLLLDICRVFLFPCLILASILHFSDKQLGILAIPTHIIFIVLWAVIKNLYTDYVQSKEARQLGAKHIPRVVGKWPGNIDILLKMMKAFKTSYILDVYLNLFEEYQCTTLNTRILWVDNIITMDQEHSKYILATGFENFWRGKSQKERMESFLGQGIFNRDDEKWKMHRVLARPFFARERVSDFEIFERQTARTIAIISSLSASETPCEAQDLYGRFTLDAASEFLFGQNLNTLSASLPVPGNSIGAKGSATHDIWGSFAQSFEEMQQIITNRSRLGYCWPLFELFEDKTAPHVKTIREWLDPLVIQVVEEKAKLEKMGLMSPVGEKSFLQHLADSTEDTGLIRDQLLSMLLASRDTTACLLTYITYFMAIYPEVAQKMRKEVLRCCGSQGMPTYDSIRNLKYMRAVIQETLRLFPPVPLNVRESRPKSFALPHSDPTYASSSTLYMPQSTGIVYLPLLMHRNPALWGPDADTFDPERWLQPDRLARFTSNPMMFSPFSAGPRVCIGQNYAYNEASYFLVRLLQQFDTFTLASDVQPESSLPPPEWKHRKGRQAYERVWPGAALTLYVKGGLWVRFSRST